MTICLFLLYLLNFSILLRMDALDNICTAPMLAALICSSKVTLFLNPSILVRFEITITIIYFWQIFILRTHAELFGYILYILWAGASSQICYCTYGNVRMHLSYQIVHVNLHISSFSKIICYSSIFLFHLLEFTGSYFTFFIFQVIVANIR